MTARLLVVMLGIGALAAPGRAGRALGQGARRALQTAGRRPRHHTSRESTLGRGTGEIVTVKPRRQGRQQ